MKTWLLALLCGLSALARADAPAAFAKELAATDQQRYALKTAVARAPFTVVEFFSATCPCQESHDPKLVALARKYAPQGVQVLAVDSNFGASVERNLAQTQRRGYVFPIVADPDGIWLAALGAKFATDVFVLDREGRVRYRGGIDSESHPVTDRAKPYLDNALEALLAGHEPNPAVTHSLGCALQRW